MRTSVLEAGPVRSRESTQAIKSAARLLRQIDRGARFNHRLLLRFIATASGMRFPGAVRAACRQRALPGASLELWTHAVMLGPSAWSVAERELMAAMAAKWNDCAFCREMLAAAAARQMGRAAVAAALSDHRSAPISAGLKATLDFLEIMLLRPGQMTDARVDAVLDSGISLKTLIDAMEVGVVLKLISPYASALDFAAPTSASAAAQPTGWPVVPAGSDLQAF